MTTKKLLTIFLLILSINLYFSQEVVIKDDKVLLDAKQILKAEKINVAQYSFFTMKDDDEILMYKYKDNETPTYVDDDYFILNFLSEKTKVESKDFTKIANFMNSRKGMEKLVKWLLKERVINNEGELNPDRVQIFKEKYDENITERTLR
jgi:regulatory protein YycI of two-component signal transduction system YycFG